MNMRVFSIVHLVLALALAPGLLGLVNRVKALAAGRRGRPLLQGYRDLGKLLGRGAVYSRTAGWVFRAGPLVGLAAASGALLLVPLGGIPALLSFSGDWLLMAYLLGLMRFFTILAAFDTGSSFEGMGASREALFSALAEPALLVGLTALAVRTGAFSLSGIYGRLGPGVFLTASGPVVLLVLAVFLIVFLAENARIPVDDPNTHLELTMIHEVMVLDHGGPDLAVIQYAAALKFWILGALLAGLLVPVRSGSGLLEFASGLLGLGVLAVMVGAVESGLARLRLVRVPQLLVGAGVLALLGAILALR